MMYHNYICLALLLCGLVTTPAFAQKSNPKKIIQALTTKSVQNNLKNSAVKGIKPKIARYNNRRFPSKDVHFDPTIQRLLLLQVKQSTAKYKNEIVKFRLFDSQVGIIPTVANFWDELAESMKIVRQGPVSFVQQAPSLAKQQVSVSPETLRQNLLQKEQNLQQAFKRWKDLPRPHDLMTFFRNESYNLSVSIESYLLEEKDFFQLMALNPGIQHVQDQILSWAHGQGKYPFTIETLPRILQLENYTASGYETLYKNLNSPGCHTLRAWGWQDEDIRQFIQFYQTASKHAEGVHTSVAFYWERSFNTAINWLHLHKYTPSEITALYTNVESSDCNRLRFFGWTDDGIRRVIKFYQDFTALDCPSNSEYILEDKFSLYDYYNRVWRSFFNLNIKKHESEVHNIRQQLENNR